MTNSVPFVVFEDATGKILRAGAAAVAQIEAQATSAGESAMPGVGDPMFQRVVDGEIVDKDPNPAEVDRLESVISTNTPIHVSNLPDPCTLFVDGEAQVVAGGSADISFAEIGQHVIWMDEDEVAYKQWNVSCIH